MHLAEHADCLIAEGVGGLFAPVDQTRTVLDLATNFQYPIIVVARSTLGTLNHTAMTVRLLRESGCKVAGIVMNGFESDALKDDPSIATNQRWIEKLTGMKVLAVLPRVARDSIELTRGRLPDEIMTPIRNIDWPKLIAPPARLLM
jgi:dethiobiotin synthetase